MPGDERIFSTISDWNRMSIEFVLATVVGVRGSTYRGLGARQLIAADGTSVGTVSGGCLDQDLGRVAVAVLAEGQPRLVEFDLTSDDEAVWGWGIGCNGATQLLVEPGSKAISLVPLIEGPGEGILHTLTGPETGSHQTVGLDHPPWGEEVEAALVDGRHRRVSRDGVDYLLEVKSGRPRLVVCGAGHDAVPLVRLGHEMGFEVIVVDDRRPFLTLERFPEASALVQCAPADLATHIEPDLRTAFVIMSHNYLRDVDFLGSLLGHPAAYVGCLGPGERLERMLKDLAATGHTITFADRAHLHGPAGLDLGADGPTEIALSVLAEILAVRRTREGGFLVDKKGPAELRRLS